MRIIAGELRGRRLHSPKGNAIRPTSDRVRESLFNMLAARIDFEDLVVADLYCGTGAMGIEALSRGANEVTFVDQAADSIFLARRNVTDLGIDPIQTKFICQSTLSFLETWTNQSTCRFDVVLADPPYGEENVDALIDAVLPVLTQGGLFALEHETGVEIAQADNIEKSRKYGRTTVTIFRSVEPDESL